MTFTSPASRYPPLLTAGLWLVGFAAVLWLAGALTLGHWGAAALAAGLLTLLLAAPIALVLPVTRRVLEAGHTHQDLVQAVRDDVERQHKTLAFQFGAGETRTERLARRAAYAGMGLFGLGGAASMLLGGLALDAAMGAMVVGALTAVGAGAVAATRHLRRRDVVGERWLRFWSSRLGEWVAKLAGLRLRRLPAGAPPGAG